jgi:hypothetical protein
MRKYRPSNGSEGLWFMGKFCDRCANDSEGDECEIIALTMALDVDDDGYPEEWTYKNGDPVCTKFVGVKDAN